MKVPKSALLTATEGCAVFVAVSKSPIPDAAKAQILDKIFALTVLGPKKLGAPKKPLVGSVDVQRALAVRAIKDDIGEVSVDDAISYAKFLRKCIVENPQYFGAETECMSKLINTTDWVSRLFPDRDLKASVSRGNKALAENNETDCE